jgi:acyl-CoA reductase-like NAD-dependent aldehyde dehydrogenase
MAVTFNSVDPRTGEPGPSYVEATPEDVRAAVAAAAEVHRTGALRDRAARVALLRGAPARVRAAADEIVAVCEAETGLPEARLRSELERACGQLEAFAGIVERGDEAEAIIDHADPDAVPIPKPDVRRMQVPLGPIAVFGASNFPLAFSTAGGDTASALAAGCPVIVKGHPSHPGTGELIADELRAAVAEAGLPAGAFANLPAAGVEVGEALVDAPEIAAVGFTGSFAGGKAIFDRAALRPVPVPVYAEMGSINPIVVTEAALRARAGEIAEGLAASVANFGGQLCTKPGVVFVPAGPDGDAFAADLAARLDAAGPSVLLNERLRDALRASLERLAAHPSVRALGSAPAADGPGFRHQPTAYEAPAAAVNAELLEERFGPIVLLLRHGSREELLAALAHVEGQLTGSVHAEPEDDVAEIVAALAERAGRVVFDGYPTGVAVTQGMHHGGPFPATTSPLHTSVGMTAVRRFTRPIAFQNAPARALPPELHPDNPLGIRRKIDGEYTTEPG